MIGFFEKRLRRMEHKLNESEKMVVSFKETSVSVAEANPILESGQYLARDKMFKVFLDHKLI
jgi:tRNA uridine 5-carboxymethylaminomethyl modification enzyme